MVRNYFFGIYRIAKWISKIDKLAQSGAKAFFWLTTKVLETA